MANTLKFKRGLLAGLPTAAEGEPLFTTDSNDLYIGTSTGNQRFQKYIASGATTQILRGDGSLYSFPLAISSPSNGQVLKFNGTNWVNDSDAGITGSGSAGQVAYFTGATTQAGSNNLFWDNTNGRLGIGLNNPAYTFHALSSASTIGAFRNSGAAIGQLLVGNTAGDLVLRILASGDALIYSDTGKYLAFGSNGGTERVRIYSGGNVGVNTASLDTGQRFQVNGNIYFNGSTSSTYIAEINQANTTAGTSFGTILRGGTNVSDTALRVQNAAASANLFSLQGDGSLGLGTTSLTGYNVRISKTLTNSVSYGVAIDGTIQETVSNTAVGFYTALSTLANVFTLPNLYHFNATQGTFGVGSVVTNQYGFRVSSNLIGATNNYAFFGEIPSATNRWNLYMSGSANNYLAGSLGIGATVPSEKLHVIGGNARFDSSNINVIARDTGTGYSVFVAIGQNGSGAILDSGVHGSTANSLLTGAPANSAILATRGAHQLHFGTNGNSRMFIDANGNLLVGAATTTYKFDVQTSSQTIANLSSSNVAGGYVAVGRTASVSIFGSYASASGGGTLINADALFFRNNSAGIAFSGSGATPKLWLTTLDNLVLNSTSDTGERLQVNGTAKITGVTTLGGSSTNTITLSPNTGNPNIEISGGAGSASNGASAYYRLRDVTNSRSWLGQINANGGLDFWFQYGGTFYNRVTFDNLGSATFAGGLNIGTSLSVNVATINGSAIIQADSTTKGFLPPRMTTTQKNAIGTPAAGLVVYDTTLNKLCVYTTAWETITSV